MRKKANKKGERLNKKFGLGGRHPLNVGEEDVRWIFWEEVRAIARKEKKRRKGEYHSLLFFFE